MGDNSFSKRLGLLILLAGAALLFGGAPIVGVLLGVVGFAVLGVVLLVGMVVFVAFKGIRKKQHAKSMELIRKNQNRRIKQMQASMKC